MGCWHTKLWCGAAGGVAGCAVAPQKSGAARAISTWPAQHAAAVSALLAAVVIYTYALDLFGVEATMGQMLGYLPVIFFGAATPGPMRTVAITLWVVLFPGNEGEMAAFGFVQHNFFIFFNAAIGLLFLRRANRELFDEAQPAG